MYEFRTETLACAQFSECDPGSLSDSSSITDSMVDANAAEKKNWGIVNVSDWNNVNNHFLFARILDLTRLYLVLASRVSSVCACVSIPQIRPGQSYHYMHSRESLKPLYRSAQGLPRLQSIIEMSASIVVCCMPTAAVVFKHYRSPMVTRFSIYRHSRRIESNAGEIDQLPIYTGNATSHANVTGGKTLQKSKEASILVTTKYDRGDIIPLEPTNIFVTTSVDMTKEEKVKEKR